MRCRLTREAPAPVDRASPEPRLHASTSPSHPGRTRLLLRLDLCLFLFGITPSCPSWRIARRERFFPSLFDFKFCRVLLNRLTPFVRFSCAHAGNLERKHNLASTTFEVELTLRLVTFLLDESS